MSDFLYSKQSSITITCKHFRHFCMQILSHKNRNIYDTMSNDLCSPFNCNVCLLFKSHEEKDQHGLSTEKDFQQLLTCNGCQLIKYCNSQHQKLDWPIHQQFCRAVQKIKENLKLTHPFYISGVPENKQNIEKAVIQIKYLLKNALGRSLEYHEEELTSFPAYCGQCYKMQSLKYICTKCYCQYYCSEHHKEAHKEEHDKVCRLLQIYYCPYKVQPFKEEFCMRFGSRIIDLHKLDLYSCITKLFSIQLPLNPCSSLHDYQIFSWASDFSCVMTICYAMELLEFQKLKTSNLNIFILGASIEAILWFHEIHCQLLFLQYPKVTKIELDFIGPEVVEPNIKELKFTFLGCERLVKFKTYRGLFQDYCKHYNIRTHLIMVFNCGFSEFSQRYNLTPNISSLDTLEPLDVDRKHRNADDTWFDGLIEILHTFYTPIVFTSFTEQESAFDFGAFQNAANNQPLKVHIDHIFKANKNPFHDLRPLRQWYSIDEEEFYFRNGYIQAIRSRLQN